MGLVGPIAKRYFEGGGPWGNLDSPTNVQTIVGAETLVPGVSKGVTASPHHGAKRLSLP